MVAKFDEMLARVATATFATINQLVSDHEPVETLDIMETLVLCPEELCLGPVRLTASNIVGLAPPTASDFSIWTSGDLEKGTRFVPWKGTVRSDKLPVHEKLPEFDVSLVKNHFMSLNSLS